jgi:hypothetical protein
MDKNNFDIVFKPEDIDCASYFVPNWTHALAVLLEFRKAEIIPSYFSVFEELIRNSYTRKRVLDNGGKAAMTSSLCEDHPGSARMTCGRSPHHITNNNGQIFGIIYEYQTTQDIVDNYHYADWRLNKEK